MNKILIHEVGPRDGLQAEAMVVPTEVKLDWIRHMADSGVDIILQGSGAYELYPMQKGFPFAEINSANDCPLLFCLLAGIMHSVNKSIPPFLESIYDPHSP